MSLLDLQGLQTSGSAVAGTLFSTQCEPRSAMSLVLCF
jgi:hypothetical protein